MDIKLVVVGSRTFKKKKLLYSYIDKLRKKCTVVEIISGGAKGADIFAECYAKDNNIPFKLFKPKWNQYGNYAGLKRNIEMVLEGDKVLAFWDGKSKGTKHTIKKAILHDKLLKIIWFEKK